MVASSLPINKIGTDGASKHVGVDPDQQMPFRRVKNSEQQLYFPRRQEFMQHWPSPE
jgi:hypothetical protein